MKTTLFIFSFALAGTLHAQTLPERMAIKTCECLDTVTTYQQMQDSIVNCSAMAMVLAIMEGTPKEAEIINTVDGLTKTLDKANELLPSVCPHVRSLILEEKKNQFYGASPVAEANDHYISGNIARELGDYDKAVKEYTKSLNLDKKFVSALDHLGLTYRLKKEYKKALKYYLKSLDIFPEGDIALLNIAVVYSFTNDFDKALSYYTKLANLYPNNPEGYFGCGKILYLQAQYGPALDNVFTAHRMYVETNSDYVKDSETLMSIMYAKLKSLDKLSLFEEKAKAHNIVFGGK
ncbi:MAG: tetratricopeptide repeat protein [Flavobacteriales bacterium]